MSRGDSRISQLRYLRGNFVLHSTTIMSASERTAALKDLAFDAFIRPDNAEELSHDEEWREAFIDKLVSRSQA